MTTEQNNEIKKSLQNDFNKWLELPITKFFFKLIKLEIKEQRKALENVYISQAQTENKLTLLGGYSHAIKVLNTVINTKYLSDINPIELEKLLNEEM